MGHRRIQADPKAKSHFPTTPGQQHPHRLNHHARTLDLFLHIFLSRQLHYSANLPLEPLAYSRVNPPILARPLVNAIHVVLSVDFGCI
jgi:hypothetical protein